MIAAAVAMKKRHLRLFVGYSALQTAAITAFYFVPADGWVHALWQVVVGLFAAGTIIVAVRRRHPVGALAWYLFGAGVAANVGGILAAFLVQRPQTTTDVGVVDLLWLGLFPGLVCGMAILIRHRTVERDWTALIDAAIITTGFCLLAWVFLIRPAATAAHISVVARAMAIAYPVGDLVVLGVMLRIVLGGGLRNASLLLMVAAVFTFLSADLGWAILSHLGLEAGPVAQHVLEMTSMSAYALFGASALHPSSSTVAVVSVRRGASLSPLLLGSLTMASLIAPAILWFQVARNEITDGGAIALGAAVLFILVVVRMSQLVRRVEERTKELAERNRAVRLVLDNVTEGLMRVTRDGKVMLERSATIDRWFRSFEAPLPFVDFIAEFDREFAVAFRLGYEALLEDLLPAELCLAQLPSSLRCNGRDYKVSYLPVDGNSQNGLLVVVEDVTELLLRATQDADQRELLAMFQALTRDRMGFMSFFEEASRLVESLSLTSDVTAQKRLIHTLKGTASMACLNLVVAMCDQAEEAIEADASRAGAMIETVRRRWRTLADAFHVLIGDQGRDAIALQPGDLQRLREEIAGGLPAAQILERLTDWSDEAVDRPLGRLANYAAALAARLGKGEVAIEVDGHGVKLDKQKWAPFWSELVHVVRNAVDHGWESPAERRDLGKPEKPRMRLTAQFCGGELAVEIEDDGRGIDWEAIRRVAVQRGVPAGSEDELVAALLSDGLSTREEPSVLSGRGIGMAAVAARVEELAGRIDVKTRRGEGTRWRLSFPVSSMARQRAKEGRPTESIRPALRDGARDVQW